MAIRQKAAAFAVSAVLALMLTVVPAQAQISDGVVRIGILNDQSGPYQDLAGPGSVVAAQLAAEDFGGKVAGGEIEIVSADHQNKPDVGAAIARRWFDEQGVDAIADVPTSSVAIAVQGVAREKHRIFLISGGSVTDLSGKYCSPYGIQTADDTYAYTSGTARAVVQNGGKTWFLLVADYAAGHAVEAQARAAIEKAGGQVVGSVRHPQGTPDFAAYLLQAEASGAQVIGLGNYGNDTINSIKQSIEFGLTAKGRKLVSFGMFISDVHALGLKNAAGLQFAEGFYWDQNDATRAFAKRFEARTGKMPTRQQATTYATVVHYLKSIAATGTDAAEPVMAHMRGSIMAYFGQDARFRPDGRLVRDDYLWEVKTPAESTAPWDYYKFVRVIPASEAWLPIEESACPLLTKP